MNKDPVNSYKKKEKEKEKNTYTDAWEGKIISSMKDSPQKNDTKVGKLSQLKKGVKNSPQETQI